MVTVFMVTGAFLVCFSDTVYAVDSYTHDVNNYRYSISTDGTEKISHNNGGTITDLIKGLGKIDVKDKDGSILLNQGSVNSWTTYTENSYDGV